MGLSTETANLWVDRWERQQQRYAIDREERFTVIADVVEHVTQGRVGRPLVVDLGCGPGCLSDRLARRLPRADIVGADMDPLLLELARARHGRAVRYVETVLGRDGWIEDLGLDRPLDAAVSTTALHYLPPEDLRRIYRRLAEVIRPGGVLVNGDHLARDSRRPRRHRRPRRPPPRRAAERFRPRGVGRVVGRGALRPRPRPPARRTASPAGGAAQAPQQRPAAFLARRTAAHVRLRPRGTGLAVRHQLRAGRRPLSPARNDDGQDALGHLFTIT